MISNQENIEFVGICLPTRVNSFIAHLEKRGLCIKIINAVQNVNDSRAKEYNYDGKIKNNLCTLSHLLALGHISVCDKEYGVVFEDDINLHKNFLTLVQELINTGLVKKYGLISIGYLFSHLASEKVIINSSIEYKSNFFTVGKNEFITYGTQAYICTQEYAMEKVNSSKCKTFASPENMILSENNKHCCGPSNRIIVYPPFVLERYDLFGTTLNHDHTSIFNNTKNIIDDYV